PLLAAPSERPTPQSRSTVGPNKAQSLLDRLQSQHRRARLAVVPSFISADRGSSVPERESPGYRRPQCHIVGGDGRASRRFDVAEGRRDGFRVTLVICSHTSSSIVRSLFACRSLL